MSRITFKLSTGNVFIEAEPSDSIASRSIDALLGAGIGSLYDVEDVTVTPEAYQCMVYRNLIDRQDIELQTFLGRPVTIKDAV